MRRHRITISGEVWTYAILDPEEYVQLHGEDSDAITDVTSKKMDFMHNTATLGNILHEVFHAYKSYLYLDDAQGIKDADYEEIYANFFSRRGLTLVATSVKMFMALHGKDTVLKDLLKIIEKVNK